MRRFLGPALAALVLAGLLAWLTRPSTTPAPRHEARHRPTPPVPAHEAPVPAPPPMLSAPRVRQPPSVQEPARRAPRGSEAPQPASTEGVATSILERRDAIEECLLDEEDAGRPFVGRPTLRVTVFAEDDVGRAEVMLANTEEHRAEAEACLDALFRDAVFEPPETEHTVVWPIPWR